MTERQIETMKQALERIADMNGRTLPSRDDDYVRGVEDAFVEASEIASVALTMAGE